jgi:AsmA protein
MDKRWLVIGAVVVGVSLFVILLVPFFVNADAFRPTIESQLSSALGREVTLDRLTFSVLQRSLVAEGITIADDPDFSKVPFIQAKTLEVGIEILPFLLHREVTITGLTIGTPSIQLLEHANGRWNFSSLGSSSSQDSPSQRTASMPDLRIDELKIVNGSAMVSSIPVTARPFEYTEVNLTVKRFSFLKSSPLELSAKLPGGGTVTLTGEAGPITQSDTSKTPFHATLQLREFDPVAGGIIDGSKGISMSSDVDGEIRSDGVQMTGTGKVKASRLQLVPGGSPTQEPVDIDYSISQNLISREATVSDIAIHAGSAAVHVNGTFKFTPDTVMLNLHLSALAVPIEQLEHLLPVVAIRLPSGSSLRGGTLTANIAITGPATVATMAGPVEINNTKLAGFDLGSKIEGLNPLGGTSNGTEIRVLKATVNSSRQGTRLAAIYGEMPQIGTANGEGNVAPSGELDFRLNAKLGGSRAVGAQTAAIATRSISLTITGTAASPSIHANVRANLR